MSDQILLATRKGLFRLQRGSDRWRIDGPSFLGVPAMVTECDHRCGTIYAGVGHGHFGPKLHRSNDGGVNFEEITTPSFDESEKPLGLRRLGDAAHEP